MRGFGVICIDIKYLPEVAFGLIRGEPISFTAVFFESIIGITVPVVSVGASSSSMPWSCERLI